MIADINIYIDDLKTTINDLVNSNKNELKKSDEVKIFEMKFKHILNVINEIINNEFNNLSKVQTFAISNLVLVLLNMMKDLNKSINTDLSIFDFVCECKLIDSIIGNELITNILGDGNEINYQNIYRYEKEIAKIKCLDNNSLIKLVNALLSINEYKLLFKLLENVSKNQEISVLKNTILSTNNTDIIAEYLLLTNDHDAITKVFKDDENYKKYAIERGIAKTYDFKI